MKGESLRLSQEPSKGYVCAETHRTKPTPLQSVRTPLRKGGNQSSPRSPFKLHNAVTAVTTGSEDPPLVVLPPDPEEMNIPCFAPIGKRFF